MVTVQHFELDQATKQIRIRPKSVGESAGFREKTPENVTFKFSKNTPTRESMHCVLSLTAQCIVIGPVCGGRALFVGVFVGLLPR